MLRAAELGKLRFELADFRAQDELAVVEHTGHRLVDTFAQAGALRMKVDEAHWLGHWLDSWNGIKGPVPQLRPFRLA
jgi:hypothetical protein